MTPEPLVMTHKKRILASRGEMPRAERCAQTKSRNAARKAKRLSHPSLRGKQFNYWPIG